MKNVLSKKDFSLIKVEGDGNCLFNCIVQQLHLHKNTRYILDDNYSFKFSKSKLYEDESENLRQLTVNWLEDNLDYILPTGLTIKQDIQDTITDFEDIDSVDEYLLDMRGYRYAGQMELYSLSNILKKNISIFIEQDGNYYTIGMGNIYNKSDKDNIYLYHNMLEYDNDNEEEFHYNLLYPKSRGNIISKKKYNELILNNKPLTRNNSNVNTNNDNITVK